MIAVFPRQGYGNDCRVSSIPLKVMIQQSNPDKCQHVKGGADGNRGAEPFCPAPPFQSICGIGLACQTMMEE